MLWSVHFGLLCQKSNCLGWTITGVWCEMWTWIFVIPHSNLGHLVAQLVQALCYESEGRRFDSWWRHWNFSLTWSFWPHNGPGIDSASNRNEYQEYFLGVKAAGAYCWLHSCADCLEIWGPQPPGTLRACPGLWLDCFFLPFTFKPALWSTLQHNNWVPAVFYQKPFSMGLLICRPVAPIHFFPSGDLSATTSSALSFRSCPQAAAAITSLTGRVHLLASFQQVVDF